jgi:hypothetical protein
VLGWSAAAIALVAFDGAGQVAVMLSYVWVVVACVALARREAQRVPVPATA